MKAIWLVKEKQMFNLTKKDQEKIARKEQLSQKDFEIIYRNYYDRVYNFVYSRISRKEDAEDLTSLVFEKVMKKLADFQWQGITITAWIYRIARNVIIDFYRKNSERVKDSSVEEIGHMLVSGEEKIETVIINDEEEIKLYNALREFKPEDQYLIYYKFFEEMSNSEIAELTGMSESNVGTRLHRVREKLKHFIGE